MHIHIYLLKGGRLHDGHAPMPEGDTTAEPTNVTIYVYIHIHMYINYTYTYVYEYAYSNIFINRWATASWRCSRVT